MNILDFQKMKQRQEKITMVTCYDYTSARMLSHTSIDCILVGDSVAMTIHGFNDTVSATLKMMTMHISAVRRGTNNKFIIGDLPFLSYRKSLAEGVSAAQKLMQAGAHAVKLEGAIGNLKLIRHLNQSGIPVMGHLGLTPQFIHVLGGFKVQGKTEDSAHRIHQCALALQEAGCFAVVLECVPSDLAKTITHSLAIPTIGIGAGPDTDGQVLVFQDLLGLQIEFKPMFLKTFVDGYKQLSTGIENYVNAVKNGEYPNDEHCYKS